MKAITEDLGGRFRTVRRSPLRAFDRSRDTSSYSGVRGQRGTLRCPPSITPSFRAIDSEVRSSRKEISRSRLTTLGRRLCALLRSLDMPSVTRQASFAGNEPRDVARRIKIRIQVLRRH